MRVLVTGSNGFLGSRLVKRMQQDPHKYEVVGLDVRCGEWTTHVGSIVDASLVHSVMTGVDVVLHTATLHKPQIATHSKQAFIDTNVTGTLCILEAAVAAGVRCVIFTSSTSAFGQALRPADSAPAVWIDESVTAPSKNIYGATKLAAEDLCYLFSTQLDVVVLRTSRFFPEVDDDPANTYDSTNLKVLELLHRRVHVDDVVDAHLLAAETAQGFSRYIISAPTPFEPTEAALLRTDAQSIILAKFPDAGRIFDRHGWRLYTGIDRVYCAHKALNELGWSPRYDFATALREVERGFDPFSGNALIRCS